MGFRVSDVCYIDNASASDAFYSSQGVYVTPSATSTLMQYAISGGVWKLQQYSISSAGAWTLKYSTNAPALTFPSCVDVNDPVEQFNDGMLLGWAIAAAMVSAWGVNQIRQRFIRR